MVTESKGVFLGPLQFQVLSLLEKSGKKWFKFSEIAAFFSEKKRASLRNAVSKLVAKKRLHRIKKGEYLLVPFKEEDYALHELAFAPVYYPNGFISFLTALRFYGLTDQLPTVVQVVVTKTARSRVFQETRYEPIRLSEKYFFGYKTNRFGDAEVKIALKEKALLDCLLHPEYCGGIGEVCKAIRVAYKTIDWKSLAYFLDRMNNSAVERRLRYCIAFIRKKVKLPEKKFKGYRKLDSSLPARGKYDSEFGLRINTDLEEEMH